MDLITHTVYALVRYPDTMASGEIHGLIDVVDATMPYAIRKCPGDLPEARSLWKTEVCALHKLTRGR
jgi:hypothetical protein